MSASPLATAPAALRLGSSLRSRPALETLACANAVAAGLGISRVTDITRMDRLGLPVCISVRPRGRTMRVHAGKGLDPVDARVGALMEAVEFAVADPGRTPWRADRLRVDELRVRWGGAFDLIDLAPHADLSFDDGTTLETLRCEDLSGGPAQPLPADTIFVPFESPGAPNLLRWSTNGLASGNTVDEASVHALFEVLERDAKAMDLAGSESLWISPEELPAPFPQLAQRWREIGVELGVRLLPNAFGLPCFEAVLAEASSDDVRVAAGHGLHLDRDIALARAVSEAAQSRLSLIHGGRDDVVDKHDHDRRLDPMCRRERDGGFVAAVFDRTRRILYAEAPDFPCGGQSIPDVLAALVGHLRELGFGQVYRHHFDIALGGLAVVRIVVPRCENFGYPCTHMGRRLRGRVLSHA